MFYLPKVWICILKMVIHFSNGIFCNKKYIVKVKHPEQQKYSETEWGNNFIFKP